MSDAQEPVSDSGHKHQFQLNILSPSPEVGRLNFPSIPISCTISQLKEKISEASETRIPLPDQQRLIYRGRVLAQENRTLGDIFGQETVDNSNEPLTIHLVFNPGSHQQHAAPSSTVPGGVQSTSATQSTQTRQASNSTESVPRDGPQNVQAAPLQVQPIPTQFPQIPGPPAHPFPQLQQTFALMNQQIAAQMAALGANPMMQNTGPNQQQLPPHQPQHQSHQPHAHHHPNHGYPNPASVPSAIPNPQGNVNLTQQQQQQQFQAQQLQIRQQQAQQLQQMRQQQQARQLQQMQQQQQQQIQHQMQQQQQAQQHAQLQQYQAQYDQLQAAIDSRAMNLDNQRPNSAPPPGIGNTNTVIRETYGPNGERHQSIISSGTIQVNNGSQVPNPALHQLESSRNGRSRSGTPSGQGPSPHQAYHSGTIPSTPLALMQLQTLQAHMSSMESALNLGTIPPTSVQEQTRTLLQVVAPSINQQQYQIFESRRQTLLNRANAMQRALDDRLNAIAEQTMAQNDMRLSTESTVYLLSSSTGPQALLISPSGYFTTPWPSALTPIVHEMSLRDSPLVNTAPGLAANAQQAHINAAQVGQPQPNGQQQLRVAEVLNQVQGQQPGAQAPNPARDIVRILIPLGGHIWLMIRLFGFVYFFTHGASWHRTILLSLVAFILFVAQTGLFQPLLQTIWGPIRRHAEALLPLAANERPQGLDEPGVANDNGTGRVGRTGEPTPQEAAERLLREREAQDGDLLRQGLRRIERAVALFVASLVPGVGERHIAAREAAELARQREEREREERGRREEEERQQAQRAEDSSHHDGDATGSNNRESNGEPSSAQASNPQPPMVEA